MEIGRYFFTGIRQRMNGPLPWVILALVIFGVGAAIGWALLGLPAQRIDSDRIVYSEPVQLIHDQMHFRMMGVIPSPASADTTPRADVPVSFHNFGTVKQSQIASWSFEIANRGAAALVISSGYTTCGCTTAELSTAEIPVDKSGLVTVYFDPQHASPGSVVRRGVILETNDPQKPQIEIWIQASVEN